jgi:uncharacterized protein YbjT (DUF2867 family)
MSRFVRRCSRLLGAGVLVTGLVAGPLHAGEPASAALAEQIRATRILVIGTTGNNGGDIVRALDAIGARPRLLVRDLARAQERFPGDRNWVQGDITRPETLGPAMQGIQVVINAAATRDATGPNNFEAVDLGGTQNVIAAAKAAGVKRIVLITGMTVGRPESEWPKMFVKGFGAKRDAEKAMIASGLEYVILRPTGIRPRPANQWSIALIAQKDYKVSADEIAMRAPSTPPDPSGPPPAGSISRADLAEVAIVTAVHPNARDRVFIVTQGLKPASDQWVKLLKRMPRN